jgi:hypothetical protein
MPTATAMGIVLTVLLLGGCGASGEEKVSTPVTEAQFVKQARLICAKAHPEIKRQRLAWERAHGGREMDWGTGLRQIMGPLLKQEAASLSALPVPEQLEGRVSRMIGNLSQGAVNFVHDGVKASPSAIDHFQAEAIALGLKDCNF